MRNSTFGIVVVLCDVIKMKKKVDNRSISTGLSILKNLGLEDEVVDDEVEMVIRPKYAGLSEEIDGNQNKTEQLVSNGCWRINGPSEFRRIENYKVTDSKNYFCSSNTFPKFQASLCKFHENFANHRVQAQSEMLRKRAKELKFKINQLEEKKKKRKNIVKLQKMLSELIESSKEEQKDFDKLFNFILKIAKEPNLVETMKIETYKYQQEQKNPFEVPRLTLTIAELYSDYLIKDDIFSCNNLLEWIKLRNWMIDVQTIYDKKAPIDKIWTKYLNQIIFPKVSKVLSLETSDKSVEWAVFWLEKGLLSHSNLASFFTDVAKQFLVKNLQLLCDNEMIHYWINLANEADLSSQFAVIVRQHADQELKKWDPSSPFAKKLLDQWPNVLGHSLDFMYNTVAPKLTNPLEFGKIEVLQPWIGILPFSLIASLVADYFLKAKIQEMDKLLNVNVHSAAKFYVNFKNQIPIEVATSPKVINKLIFALEKLKSKNPILKNLSVDKESEISSVSDLLEAIAYDSHQNFTPKGNVNGKYAYEIGSNLFGISDGVIYILKNKIWVPIFIREIKEFLIVK